MQNWIIISEWCSCWFTEKLTWYLFQCIIITSLIYRGTETLCLATLAFPFLTSHFAFHAIQQKLNVHTSVIHYISKIILIQFEITGIIHILNTKEERVSTARSTCEVDASPPPIFPKEWLLWKHYIQELLNVNARLCYSP